MQGRFVGYFADTQEISLEYSADIAPARGETGGSIMLFSRSVAHGRIWPVCFAGFLVVTSRAHEVSPVKAERIIFFKCQRSHFIEWWDNGKRHREAAGPNAQDAANRARVKEAELTAARNGIIPLPKNPSRSPNALHCPPLLTTRHEAIVLGLYGKEDSPRNLPDCRAGESAAGLGVFETARGIARGSR